MRGPITCQRVWCRAGFPINTSRLSLSRYIIPAVFLGTTTVLPSESRQNRLVLWMGQFSKVVLAAVPTWGQMKRNISKEVGSPAPTTESLL